MEDLQEVLDFWFSLTKDELLTPAPELVAETKEKFLKTYTKYKNSMTLNPQTSQEYLALIILFYHLPKVMFVKKEESHKTDSFAITLAEIAVERGYDLQIQQGKSLLYKPLLASSNLAMKALAKQLMQTMNLEADLNQADKPLDSKILHFPYTPTKEEEEPSNIKNSIAKPSVTKTITDNLKESSKKTQENAKKVDANKTEVNKTKVNKGQIVIPIQPTSKGTLLITQQEKSTLPTTPKPSSLVIKQPPLAVITDANKHQQKITKKELASLEHSSLGLSKQALTESADSVKEASKTSHKTEDLKDAKEQIPTTKIKPTISQPNKESITHNLKKHQLLHNKHFHTEPSHTKHSHTEKEKYEALGKHKGSVEHKHKEEHDLHHDFNPARHLNVKHAHAKHSHATHVHSKHVHDTHEHARHEHTKHEHSKLHHLKHHNHDEQNKEVKKEVKANKMHEIHKHNFHHIQEKHRVTHHSMPVKNQVNKGEPLLAHDELRHKNKEEILSRVHEKAHLIKENKDKKETQHLHEDVKSVKDSQHLVKPQDKSNHIKDKTPVKDQAQTHSHSQAHHSTTKEKTLLEATKKTSVAENNKKVVKEVEQAPTKEKQEKSQSTTTTATASKTTKASSVTIISKQPKVMVEICNVKETINTTPKTNLGNVVN